MISKINNIKNFGIFQNYSHDCNLSDYNRYNLFYGWNGSGKSTLSSLFECIERKEQSSEYSSSEWTIDTENTQVTQNNVSNNNLTIRVFNKSFVEKNVFTPNDKIKGIIYISEEQGKDKDELDEKTKELNKKNDRKKERWSESAEIKKLAKDIENIQVRFSQYDLLDYLYIFSKEVPV